MIKLTAKNDWQKAAFYFKSQLDCDEFISGLRDRGANIDWNKPEVANDFPEMSSQQRENMYHQTMKDKIESNIQWAFNSYCKDNPECDISGQIAESIMKNMNI